MDPIGSIAVKKDSTFAMLLAAQSRGWEIFYMELGDLSLIESQVLLNCRPVEVRDDEQDWYTLKDPISLRAGDLDVLLMRKDPPFGREYLMATYLLELAASQGMLVVNDARAIRDANEKLFTAWFPECCPPTLVSRDTEQFLAFLETHRDIIVKPLDGMGGASIFRIKTGDTNTAVILETLIEHGCRYAMAQKFIPEIDAGDKRILLINGQPVPFALARIPANGENRGNLAAGGRGEGVSLSERDRWICQQVGPVLVEKGLLFVGLDVIGDYLTEINVTSPTCIRELDALYDLDIAADLMDCIAQKIL